MLGPDDPLPHRPGRVLVAGSTGAGKTTVAVRIATALGIPHVELDGLRHGPDWVPRPSFDADVRRFAAGPVWVTEWQYDSVRDLLAGRADLLVWLDLSRSLVMRQVVRRTLRRGLRRQLLWNGNTEPPLWTVLTDREHVVRWAWARHAEARLATAALHRRRPDLTIVRLRDRAEVRRWLDGSLRARAGER